MRLTIIFLTSLAYSLPSIAQADYKLSGTVIDKMGHPVAGAIFCPQWGSPAPDKAPAPLGPSAHTDSRGYFSFQVPPWFMVSNGHVVLMVFNSSHGAGAQMSIPVRTLTPSTIRILPLHSVYYKLQIPVGFSNKISSGKMSAQSLASLAFVTFWGSRGVVKLPPGKYVLSTDVDGTVTATKEFRVAAHDVKLSPIVLRRSPIEKHYGHGIPRISELVDLRGHAFALPTLFGHWTILYFWQVSCAPCVEKGIPELIAFANAHARERKEFQIIAVHTRLPNDPIKQNDFRFRTLAFEKTIWHGAPPFPLVYDKSGQTTANWGIQQLGTIALIDPHGNLVRDRSLSMLSNKLAK